MNEVWEVEVEDGFQEGTAMIRRLERDYGARVIGYDVDPSGEIVVDVMLSGRNPAVRAVRIRETHAQVVAQVEAIRDRKRWSASVRDHTERVREVLRTLRREPDVAG